MANVAAALNELGRIDGILRTRYHYPHPIFGHIEAAREALAEPDVVPAVTTVASTEDATPAPESGTEGPAEKHPARRKARRTKK